MQSIAFGNDKPPCKCLDMNKVSIFLLKNWNIICNWYFVLVLTYVIFLFDLNIYYYQKSSYEFLLFALVDVEINTHLIFCIVQQ